MIRRLGEGEPLPVLPPSHAARRIAALFEAYGTAYPFCVFYVVDGGMAVRLDDACILSGTGRTELDELAMLVSAEGVRTVSASPCIGRRLAVLLGEDWSVRQPLRFRYAGGDSAVVPLREDMPLSRAWELIQEGFGLSPSGWEAWYLDMSHRIRHGVSHLYSLEDAATLTVQYDREGTVFFSQIATAREKQGQGLATALVRATAARYALGGKRVTLHAREELLAFYRGCGFLPFGQYCEIQRNRI